MFSLPSVSPSSLDINMLPENKRQRFELALYFFVQETYLGLVSGQFLIPPRSFISQSPHADYSASQAKSAVSGKRDKRRENQAKRKQLSS